MESLEDYPFKEKVEGPRSLWSVTHVFSGLGSVNGVIFGSIQVGEKLRGE